MLAQTFSHFRILDKLGSGGMGVVYRAEDTALGRTVALKFLPRERAQDQNALERFKQEARTASALNHPYVCTIYEIGEDSGEVYIAMEYIKGQPLRERVGPEGLPVDAVIRFGRQIAAALEHAHEHGVIHRDLKLSNIMATPQGDAKVLDFGLARRVEELDLTLTSLADASLEKTVGLAGTIPYMAPELLEGKVSSPRSDLWALGIVLYEMAAGHRPFSGKNFFQLSTAILKQPPPPLPGRVPSGLRAVIHRCLEKEPARRYQHAGEVLAALETLGSGTEDSLGKFSGVTARALATPAAGKRAQWMRRRLWILLGAAALLLLFLALQRWIWPPRIFADRGWILIADPENFTPQEFFDKALREGLTIALQQSHYLNVFPRTRVFETLVRMKKKDVAQVDEALGREICQRETIQVLLASSIGSSGGRFQITVRAVQPVTGDLLFVESEQFTRTDELFDRVDALAKRVRKDLGESLAGIKNSSLPLAKVTTQSLEALQLYSRAMDALVQGGTEQAQALLQSALELDPDFAMADGQLALVYRIAGNRGKELEYLTRAYNLRSNVTDREQRLIEGSYFDVQGQYERAVQSLVLLVSLYPDDPDAHYNLAVAYLNSGDSANAAKHLRQVLKLYPFSGAAYSFLIRVLARRNENAEAVEVYREAVARGLQAPTLRWGLGLALLGQGKMKEARDEISHLQDAGRMYENIGRLYLARISIYEGKFSSAAEQLKTDIRWDQTLASKSAELLRRYLLARIFVARGEKYLARRELEQILNSGEPEALQAEDLRRTGTLYARMGDIRSAENVLHKLEALRANLPTSFNKSSSHNLAGEIALAQGKINLAIESFSGAMREYPRFASHEGLARAYQAQQDWSRAAASWGQFLEARGEILQDSFPADWICGHLELARVYRQAKDLPKARGEYQEFFRIWQEADQLPIRQRALREWQEISGEASPSIR